MVTPGSLELELELLPALAIWMASGTNWAVGTIPDSSLSPRTRVCAACSWVIWFCWSPSLWLICCNALSSCACSVVIWPSSIVRLIVLIVFRLSFRSVLLFFFFLVLLVDAWEWTLFFPWPKKVFQSHFDSPEVQPCRVVGHWTIPGSLKPFLCKCSCRTTVLLGPLVTRAALRTQSPFDAVPNCTSGNKRGQLLLELDPLIVPGRSPGTSGSIDELCTFLVPLSYFSVYLVPLSSFRWHWFQSDTCLWCHWPQPDTSTGLRLLILLSPGSSLSFLFLGDLPSWLFSFSNYQPWRRTPVPWWVPRGQELRVSFLCLGLDSLKPLSDALLYTGFLRFCRALAPLPFRGYFASAGRTATGCQRGATRSWLPKAEPPAKGLGAGLTAA